MTPQELANYLGDNPEVEWKHDNDENFFFRHIRFDKPDECIKITPFYLRRLTVAELHKAIINGRDVDHMTRITGYFSKISGWNKGKIGELKDRVRHTV